MVETTKIAAQPRERAGKGAARAVRRGGRVPGVIYGDKQSPQLISLDPKDVDREIHKPGFTTHLFDIAVGGATVRALPRDVQLDPVTDRPEHVDFMRVSETSRIKVMVPVKFLNNDKSPGLKRGGVLNIVRHDIEGRKLRAIPRDVQLDPVRDTPVHVDFQRIGADNRVRVRVPMRYTNEALSPGLKRGGVLNIVRRDVEVWAPADKIPEVFEASLEGLEIGRSLHISAVTLPEGVQPVIQGRDFTVATIAGAAAMRPEGEEAAPGAAATTAEGAAPAAAAPAGAAKGAAPAAAAAAQGGDAKKK